MNKQSIIGQVTDVLKEKLQGAEAGHDWWHTMRVHALAKRIAQKEHADLFVVELASLLHDIADYKFHNGDEEKGLRLVAEILKKKNVEADTITHVQEIIRNMSFKGNTCTKVFSSPELDIVQDADRLDVLGAIGIARTFNYGGYKNRPLYDPNNKPRMEMNEETYKQESLNPQSTSINHFYEKVLLLKEKMNTTTGKEIAESRHQYLLDFIKEFKDEWEGKK